MLLSLLLMPLALAQEGTTSMGSGGDYYVIQPGDTLWDISARFLGSPYEWPELWSVNEYITNPHWIYPGNRIYFRLGDALNPSSASPEPGYTPASPAVVESEAPLCDFPPRFVSSKRLWVFAPGTLANDDSLEINGEVYGASRGARELGEDLYLYINTETPDDYQCGETVAVFRRQGKKVRYEGEALGHVYRELGLAKVVRVDDNVVTVEVFRSYAEIERGDLIGKPIPVSMELDVKPPRKDTQLEADVLARLTTEQALASSGEVLFLSNGTDEGLEVGTSLFLVQQGDDYPLSRAKDSLLPEEVIARVIVVRAEESWSTAVVVEANREVGVGMRAVTIPNYEE